MNKIVKTAAISAVAALALAGCSQAAATNTGNGGGAKEKIGIALPAGNQTYWTGWQSAARDAAAKLGVDATFSDAKGDANTQNDQVNRWLRWIRRPTLRRHRLPPIPAQS